MLWRLCGFVCLFHWLDTIRITKWWHPWKNLAWGPPCKCTRPPRCPQPPHQAGRRWEERPAAPPVRSSRSLPASWSPRRGRWPRWTRHLGSNWWDVLPLGKERGHLPQPRHQRLQQQFQGQLQPADSKVGSGFNFSKRSAAPEGLAARSVEGWRSTLQPLSHRAPQRPQHSWLSFSHSFLPFYRPSDFWTPPHFASSATALASTSGLCSPPPRPHYRDHRRLTAVLLRFLSSSISPISSFPQPCALQQTSPTTPDELDKLAISYKRDLQSYLLVVNFSTPPYFLGL